MDGFWQTTQNFLSNFGLFRPQHDDQETGSTSTDCEQTPPYTPTYTDVCDARHLLRSLKLPTELVLQILDHARYWPSLSFTGAPRGAEAFAVPGKQASAMVQFRAQILGAEIKEILDICDENDKPKVKEIEFEILSRDQGWTSERTEGTFNTSSWTEVSILRSASETSSPRNMDGPPRLSTFDWEHPGNLQRELQDYGNYALVGRPPEASHYPQGPEEGDVAWYLQGNRVADGNPQPYRIVWTEDRFEGNEGAGSGERFIQALKDGDELLVWARAKWIGWQCHVQGVRITARYGF